MGEPLPELVLPVGQHILGGNQQDPGPLILHPHGPLRQIVQRVQECYDLERLACVAQPHNVDATAHSRCNTGNMIGGCRNDLQPACPRDKWRTARAWPNGKAMVLQMLAPMTHGIPSPMLWAKIAPAHSSSFVSTYSHQHEGLSDDPEADVVCSKPVP